MNTLLAKRVGVAFIRLCGALMLTILLCYYLPHSLNNRSIAPIQVSKSPEIPIPIPEDKKVVTQTKVTKTSVTQVDKLPAMKVTVPTLLTHNAINALNLPVIVAPSLNAISLPKINSAIAGIKDVDQPPEILKFIQPKMPTAGRKFKGGKVLVRLIIEPNGSVKSAKVLQSQPKKIFDNAALTAAKKWRFKPAILSGKTVEVYVDVPISFKVN